MTIKRKLLLIGGISGVIVIILSISLYTSIKFFNLEIEKNNITHQIAIQVFERRLVLDEYLLHKLERSKEQWFVVGERLYNYLQSKQAVFSEPDEKDLFNNIIEYTDDSVKLFTQLITLNTTNNNEISNEIQKSQESRLASQLLVKSQDIILITNQLAQISLAKATNAQKNIIFLFAASISSLVLIISIIIILLWKNIAIPIAKLQKGTQIIAEGNLAHKVDVQNRNEIGQLAHSFNEMTIKLKNSMAKLEEELQKFQLAFENAGDQIIITNPDGIIIYANKGTENITGYSQTELIGNKPSLWGRQMEKEFYENLWKTLTTEKKVYEGEIINQRKNGEKYAAKIKVSPVFDSNKNIKYFVGIERDITKEKEIDKAKNEFVSLASHQLRTPLSAIKWYSQILLAGDAGALSEKQKTYLDKVSNNSKNMSKLVNTLLDISHFELGIFAEKPELTDMVKLAESVIDEQKVTIIEKDLSVKQKFSSNIPLHLIDPTLTRIIFQNLLSNAIKYTPEKGVIEFSMNLDNKKNICIKISDNGCGITKNQQDKIFKKFFRADNAKEQDTTGAGLGLYILQSIINHFSGKVWFESEENKGTSFFVELPLRNPN